MGLTFSGITHLLQYLIFLPCPFRNILQTFELFGSPGYYAQGIKDIVPKTKQTSNSNNNPLLRTGLAFYGANEGVKGNKLPDGSDGVFTAMEALGLHLNGTQLVVLSACETGVGDVMQGEGVFGLRRAFEEAGAHYVLSTLW